MLFYGNAMKVCVVRTRLRRVNENNEVAMLPMTVMLLLLLSGQGNSRSRLRDATSKAPRPRIGSEGCCGPSVFGKSTLSN